MNTGASTFGTGFLCHDLYGTSETRSGPRVGSTDITMCLLISAELAIVEPETTDS